MELIRRILPSATFTSGRVVLCLAAPPLADSAFLSSERLAVRSPRSEHELSAGLIPLRVSGTQEPYQNWDKLGGRFISEFGMQGYPDTKTIDYWLDGDVSERFPQSKTVGYHNKGA